MRRKARMRGERSRKSGGREQGKERGREGEREEEGREGGRERGRGELGSSLSLSLSRPLSAVAAPPPLPAPRSAPTDRRQEVPAREGAREGLSGTGGRKEGGVCPSGLTGSGYYQRQVRMQIASCLWGTGCRGGRLQSSRCLPGLLVVARVATFLEEARRTNGRRNSVTAGSRHESPRPAQGSPGCPAQPVVPMFCPQARPQRCLRQERALPAALAAGREVPHGPRLRAQGRFPGRRGPAVLHRCRRRSRPGARGAACADGRAGELPASFPCGPLAACTQLR